MASISDLLNNISSLARGIGSALGIIPSNTNPKYLLFPNQGINDIKADDKKRWLDFPQDRYVFGVIRDGDDLNYLSKGSQAIQSISSLFSGGGDSSGNDFSDFPLPITPQEITQTENFAVTIKPSQGGTIIQHAGNRYKDLVISGTTGVSPFRGATGVDQLTGAAIAQPDELKYRSGYEVFIHFRHWIKSYHQAKVNPDKKNLRMIFKNYKDWEFLIVEPLKFSMKRDASRPLLYNYSIQFKVLGHYKLPNVSNSILDSIDNAITEVSVAISTARGIFLKFQDVIRSSALEIDSFTENLRNVNLAVKAAIGIKLTATDMSNRIQQNFLTQRDALNLLLKLGVRTQALANPATIKSLERAGIDLSSISLTGTPEQVGAQLQQVARGFGGSGNPKNDFFQAQANLGDLNSQIGIEDFPPAAQQELINEQVSASGISRQKMQTILTQGISIRDKFADSIQLSGADYDDVYGITSTFNGIIPTDSVDVQFQILYAFSLAIQQLEQLLSNDQLFDINQNLFSRTDSNSSYLNIGAGIISFPDPQAGIKEGIVPFGATLESIALSELGSTSRWTELAELNNLKPPFIDNTNSSGSRINLSVQSAGYSNPTQLQHLAAGFQYIVAISPSPTGAWIGKPNFIATFSGGDPTVSTNWNFRYPDDGMTAQVFDSQKVLEFSILTNTWSPISLAELMSGEVLRPGDLIKIPIIQRPDNNTIQRGPRDNATTNGLSQSEKSLGVDLKLGSDGDLIITPNGDLDLSVGTVNGAQAIILKLLYSRGEVKSHPELGTKLQIGGKIQDIGVVRAQILTTLLQDSRIQDVKNVNLFQQGSTIMVSMDVYFKNIQSPVPVTIPA
jgi:hypothetical protein